MSETEPKEETLAELHTRLMQEREEKLRAVREGRLKRDVERMKLAALWEQKLGREGSEFMIYDSGFLEDPLVVLKRPATVQWTKYEQSKGTPADRYDFVSPSVVHPSIDEFNNLNQKRAGVGVSCSNILGHMLGLRATEEEGK